jgi:alpha-tubulin suppressor-like RCC1 family protein
MKFTLINRAKQEAFALPTVLIASVVMLIVLLSAIGASSSIRSAIDSQYYNQIAREAVESGLTLATECLKKNPNPGWTDASPLRPGSSCNGSATENGYVIDTPTLKTSFTVGNYSIDADGRTTVDAKGIVSLRSTSSPSTVVRTFDQNSSRFVQIVPLVTAMWGNYAHTCAVASKQVFCWGDNTYGQLGDTTTTDHLTPQPIKYLNGLQPGTIIDIGVGNEHTCARAWSGGIRKLWCWGHNQYGQLGDGTVTSKSGPVPVTGLIAGLDVQDFSVGAYGACAIAGSRAFCWGWNPDGQIGDGTTTDRASPTKASLLVNMDQISTDNYHTCAHTTADQVYCWGRNSYGQLGNGTTTNSLTPVQLTPPTGTTPLNEVRIGSLHTCVRATMSGTWRVLCTGYNAEGALGTGTTANKTTVGTAAITGAMGSTAITSFSLGGYQTCAVTKGKVYCWGRNVEPTDNTIAGDVGDGTKINRLSPVAVTDTGVLAGKTIDTVAASGQYTCAFDTQQAAYCWGRNDFGQLGDGTATSPRLSPVKVNTSLFNPVYTDF